ncbi:hypothetical protein RLEG3_12345 [Rhizobium leguminosarum bv. trifolii WSM1689]|uniref:hypothetical protein n=1 Tax=Rhizobium leguminosarum TaxID=384 RepID=UPI0003E0AC5F|nr:hypothetical protein [Rhizobium leguminosarum]AHF86641.1 hypothetical protein RLEG3_12345 [Rhizobium leguminosarum bv. trifolii WSM1689]
MDKQAFEKLKGQAEKLERDVARIRSRTSALEERLDIAIVSAKDGLLRLRNDASSDGADLSDVRNKTQQMVNEKVSDLAGRATALATRVQELPDRVADLSNPAHWELMRESTATFVINAAEAGANVAEYVSNAIPDDVLSPSLEALDKRVMAIESSAEDAAEQIESGLGDWNERLKNAAETIAGLQENWAIDLSDAWESRAAELSDELAERVAAVRQRGDDLIEKISDMIETVSTAFASLSDLRETVDSGSQAAQGGLGTITELVAEVKGLLEAVK